MAWLDAFALLVAMTALVWDVSADPRRARRAARALRAAVRRTADAARALIRKRR
ncbi:hypothetical protein [Spongiactinospora sp. TRM90649]|uniref:hypothetical protein n=1 Tax=Spongiactinospora sp. TRM90649 TaxID=3031114 RepID=UPI0023F84B9B|nr:hypothetical protein [Spongiactinospora sp. TRM90649]MDF5751205.1 hypothetical protein [Spongiactinospora sp. TRM90649]